MRNRPDCSTLATWKGSWIWFPVPKEFWFYYQVGDLTHVNNLGGFRLPIREIRYGNRIPRMLVVPEGGQHLEHLQANILHTQMLNKC